MKKGEGELFLNWNIEEVTKVGNLQRKVGDGNISNAI